MGTELQNVDQPQALAQWMSPKALVTRLNRLKEVYRTVMKKDTHYGKIPGCPQDSLWQPGSQVLCLCFGLGHEPTNVEEFKDDDEIRYRVTDRVFDQKTGITIGYGIGECSSSEEKYKWRKAVSQKEFDATDDDRKRIKYGRDYEVNQVRTNPADVANTILKMARKRANVNGTIEALAASEVFTQDLEDLPEGMDVGRGEGPGSTKPNVTPDQVKARAPQTSEPGWLRGTVKAAFSKSGEKGGKTWTKYSVSIGEKSYSTFDQATGENSIALKGKEVEFQIEVSGKYENLKAIRPAPAPAASQPPQEPAKASQPSTSPAVEDAASFASTLVLVAAGRGIEGEVNINNILDAEFSCTLDTVPAESQAAVLAHFEKL